MEENGLKKKEISQKIQNYIEGRISALTRKAGIYCRIFSRVKEVSSIKKKMSKKNYTTHHKMQDILGVRIIFYFNEDVEIFKQYLKYSNHFEYDSESLTISDIEKAENILREDKWSLQDKLFMPTRLNVVFRADDEMRLLYTELFEELQKEEIVTEFIDETFEIQFRTVLSEGWHEVEHDLRYKCQADWVDMTEESRFLNGIYAALETNEHAMDMLFANMARKYYQQENWEAMVRSVVRLHMMDSHISSEIRKCFESRSNKITNAILYLKRERLIRALLTSPDDIELTMDNVILLINQLQRTKFANKQLLQYAIDNEGTIALINGTEIKKQIAEERLSSATEKNIQLSTSLTPMGSPITIITLKNNIHKVPVLNLVNTYIKHVNKNEIVVINLDEIDEISKKHIDKYLASLFIVNEKKPIFIIWNKFNSADTSVVNEFTDALRHAISERIDNGHSSDVVPNSVPKLKVEAIPSTSWYKVSLEDNMYL